MNKDGIIASIDKLGNPALTTIIMPLITINPYWQLAIISAIGLFGVYLQYNQDKLNEFIKFIQDNPKEFTKEIIQTESFKDGFLIIFEAYIKERNEEKRNYIKNIFLGFTKIKEEDKKKFELEKILHILKICTLEEIEFLKFLKINIAPLLNKKIEDELNRFAEIRKEGNFTGTEGNDISHIMSHNPLTNFISIYLKENIHDEKELTMKNNYYYQLKKQTNSLGIYSYHTQISGGGIGSPGITTRDEYNFNDIGKQFIEYIMK